MKRGSVASGGGRKWQHLAIVFLALAGASCGREGSEAGASTSRSAILSGSTFEGNDGNLVVNAAGNQDWDNAPNRVVKVDKASGTGDDAFGQGAKEDLSNPSVVSGSIPPNKSDLCRVYVAHETANGNFYLYVAWERTNVLGSANMDFEFNQLLTPDGNGVTPGRTAGDILITFDFVNGGGTPVLGLLRWVTSGATSQCFANNSLPCWGNRVNLSASGFADGAVNTVDVTDPVPPGAPRTLPALTFGEAAVNLTAAGVFPAGACVTFASAYLKSRSSASFTAELKDFIAPANANISNCGSVSIHKQDDLGAPLQGAVFTLFNDLAPKATTAGGAQTSHGAEDTSTSFTCTTSATGDCSMTSVPNGDYWAVETTGVANHDLAADQSFSLNQGTATVSLTFVDPRDPGAIVVTKTAKNHTLGGNPPLPGVTFELWNADASAKLAGPLTSNANGQVCFDGLTLGLTYTVKETGAPTGYLIDTASKTVSVTKTASCSATTDAATLSFTDTPLSSFTVSFTSKAGAGVTAGTIACAAVGDTLPTPTSLASPFTLDNLSPAIYNCQIVVDP